MFGVNKTNVADKLKMYFENVCKKVKNVKS